MIAAVITVAMIVCFLTGYFMRGGRLRNLKSDIEELTDENEELRCALVKSMNELRRVK